MYPRGLSFHLKHWIDKVDDITLNSKEKCIQMQVLFTKSSSHVFEIKRKEIK